MPAIRLDFADPSKHLFRLVRREGKTEGQGPLSGAAVHDSGSFNSVCTGSTRYLRPVWHCVRSRDTGDWGSTGRSTGAAESGAGFRRLLALVFRRLAGSHSDRRPAQGFDRNSHGFSSVCCGNDAELSDAPGRIPVGAITLVAGADRLIE